MMISSNNGKADAGTLEEVKQSEQCQPSSSMSVNSLEFNTLPLHLPSNPDGRCLLNLCIHLCWLLHDVWVKAKDAHSQLKFLDQNLKPGLVPSGFKIMLALCDMCIPIKQQEEGGIHPFLFAVNPKMKLAIMVMKSTTAGVSMKDVVDDLRGYANRENYSGERHAGFTDRTATLPIEIALSYLAQGYQVIITGHSLGGAVAQLYAANVLQEMTQRGSTSLIRLRCITFGTPQSATPEFWRRVSQYSCNFDTYVFGNDAVFLAMAFADDALDAVFARFRDHAAKIGELAAMMVPGGPIVKQLVATAASTLCTWSSKRDIFKPRYTIFGRHYFLKMDTECVKCEAVDEQHMNQFTSANTANSETKVSWIDYLTVHKHITITNGFTVRDLMDHGCYPLEISLLCQQAAEEAAKNRNPDPPRQLGRDLDLGSPLQLLESSVSGKLLLETTPAVTMTQIVLEGNEMMVFVLGARLPSEFDSDHNGPNGVPLSASLTFDGPFQRAIEIKRTEKNITTLRSLRELKLDSLVTCFGEVHPRNIPITIRTVSTLPPADYMDPADLAQEAFWQVTVALETTAMQKPLFEMVEALQTIAWSPFDSLIARYLAELLVRPNLYERVMSNGWSDLPLRGLSYSEKTKQKQGHSLSDGEAEFLVLHMVRPLKVLALSSASSGGSSSSSLTDDILTNLVAGVADQKTLQAAAAEMLKLFCCTLRKLAMCGDDSKAAAPRVYLLHAFRDVIGSDIMPTKVRMCANNELEDQDLDSQFTNFFRNHGPIKAAMSPKTWYELNSAFIRGDFLWQNDISQNGINSLAWLRQYSNDDQTVSVNLKKMEEIFEAYFLSKTNGELVTLVDSVLTAQEQIRKLHLTNDVAVVKDALKMLFSVMFLLRLKIARIQLELEEFHRVEESPWAKFLRGNSLKRVEELQKQSKFNISEFIAYGWNNLRMRMASWWGRSTIVAKQQTHSRTLILAAVDVLWSMGALSDSERNDIIHQHDSLHAEGDPGGVAIQNQNAVDWQVLARIYYDRRLNDEWSRLKEDGRWTAIFSKAGNPLRGLSPASRSHWIGVIQMMVALFEILIVMRQDKPKIVMCGLQQVGKTTLFRNICGENVPSNYFAAKNTRFPASIVRPLLLFKADEHGDPDVDESATQMAELIDTPGMGDVVNLDIFMISQCVRRASGAVVVTDQEQLNSRHLASLLNHILTQMPERSEVLVLVNKMDQLLNAEGKEEAKGLVVKPMDLASILKSKSFFNQKDRTEKEGFKPAKAVRDTIEKKWNELVTNDVLNNVKMKLELKRRVSCVKGVIVNNESLSSDRLQELKKNPEFRTEVWDLLEVHSWMNRRVQSTFAPMSPPPFSAQSPK